MRPFFRLEPDIRGLGQMGLLNHLSYRNDIEISTYIMYKYVVSVYINIRSIITMVTT